MRKIFPLMLGDVKNILKDPMLMASLFAPILIAFVLRYGIPLASVMVQNYFAFDLSTHYAFIVSVIVLLVPVMSGVLVGFIILDERDEGLLSFFSITPLAKRGYLAYRILAPMILSLFMSFFVVGFSNLVIIHYLAFLPISVMMSLEAPIMALFLAAFAANKVEGFAYSKASGIFIFAPAAAYFIPSKWSLLLGVIPPFWVSKAFLSSGILGGSYWFYILGGFLVHGIILYLLFTKFKSIQD